ncbi:MAG TPA: LOG family protein [bacterium]|nr:LOG family protein [bacterium]
MKPKIITVFGSSQLEENYPDYQKAVLIGRLLAQAGFTVCNGGYGGIMEASARGAKDGGGETIGIVTQEFHRKPNRWIDEIRNVKTWRDRLFQLIETGDAYVLFDGGTGTLVELMAAWEMINKKMMKKPVIVFGPFLRRLVSLLRKQHLVISNDSIKVAKTAQDVLDRLHEAF